MKLLLATVIAASALAAPAAAQSLHETHERVWAPAGKSLPVTWRMRERPQQIAANHHQAGKGPMPAVRNTQRDAELAVTERRGDTQVD